MFNKRKETTYLYFTFLSIIILIFSSCSSEYSQIRNEKKTELLGDIQTIEAKVIEILSERSK